MARSMHDNRRASQYSYEFISRKDVELNHIWVSFESCSSVITAVKLPTCRLPSHTELHVWDGSQNVHILTRQEVPDAPRSWSPRARPKTLILSNEEFPSLRRINVLLVRSRVQALGLEDVQALGLEEVVVVDLEVDLRTLELPNFRYHGWVPGLGGFNRM